MTIDPITFARFMVLKGAAELVESFSAIPEGALRDSIVSHARVMAQTYEEARANGAPIPDPLDLAARSSPLRLAQAAQPLALPQDPSPPAKANGHDPGHAHPEPKGRVKIDSTEAQAVRLRMSGQTPAEIASALEIDVTEVTAALAVARKAGIKFKALPKAPIGDRPKSANWNTDWSSMTGPARARVEMAAATLGLGPEGYLERKATLLDMRQRRQPWAEIIKACKPLSEHQLWRWVYQARAAGYDIPSKMDDDTQAEGPAVIDVVVEDIVQPKRFYPPFNELAGVDLAAVERAARVRGMSPQAYNERREYILQLRLQGQGTAAIAALTGNDPGIKDILAHARHRWGLTFPPLISKAARI